MVEQIKTSLSAIIDRQIEAYHQQQEAALLDAITASLCGPEGRGNKFSVDDPITGGFNIYERPA